MTRALTAADLPALVELTAAYDTHWFGQPESDADEVQEGYDAIASLATESVAVTDGGRVLGAAWTIGTDVVLSVDPVTATQGVYNQLLAWIEGQDRTLTVTCLSRDDGLRSILTRRGWAHDHSAFELVREVAPDWVLAQPEWPSQLRLTALEQPELVHDLIYRRAGWANVVGHGARDFQEWQRLFLPDAVKPADQIIAWQGGEMVGVAIGRIFSDGVGWVSQLAVPVEHRGRGLGRALLLALLDRHLAAGATKLGLQVSAKNPGALALYLDVGLTIDREWQAFHRH